MRIQYRDVLYIIAKNNYSIVVDINFKKTCIHTTLRCLEEWLPHHVFMRVHRSYIISLEKIDLLLPDSVKIKGEEIPVSDQYYDLLEAKLNKAPNDCGCQKAKFESKQKQEIIM